MLEMTGLDPLALPDPLLCSAEPVLLRGLLADWPAVQLARQAKAPGLAHYLRGFYRDATVGAWSGPVEIQGRFFYDQAFTGFNFKSERLKLDQVLDTLLAQLEDPQAPALYVGSTTVDTCLPGFREANDLKLGDRQPLMSLWLGNRSRIAAHYDLPDNLACVVAGRRRFTLFAPEQIDNLYVGPLDFTPAGQAISLVDFAKPDFEQFPKFAQALQAAQVAELGPGDAIFIPSMWWHHVEALEPFNLLVNYWWRQSPEQMDAPVNALMLALMTLRDLPPAQRRAWAKLFDHYVFAADAETAAHIPAHARRVLAAPLDEDSARMLRARLLKNLNR
ncbi:cupin-like domain-containing protein [Roseateles sp.]|uniref:cupin-like domain-containing protein n=1 Tax=Roseateles sp. TaxID=1971397 RepID=UPI00286BF804|nr:cupin-like domain-containing protein [Roseateles sp.]